MFVCHNHANNTVKTRLTTMYIYCYIVSIHHITLNDYIVLSLNLLCSIFTYYAFEQCSKNLPVMLNIMSMTTAIMLQFVYDFIVFILYLKYLFYWIICDWIWENPASTHKYKYLEIPNSIIWSIITQEGKQMLAWNLPRFYSYL